MPTPFDPDAYAAEPGKPFDPDAYAAPEKPRRIDASPTKWSQKLGEGMLPGFNRVTAAVQAATDPIIPGRTEEWGPDFATRFDQHLRANRDQSARTQAEAPIASALLQTAGALPTAVAAGPATAGQAALLGAGYTVGETQGRDLDEILADAILGAGGGRATAALPRAFLGVENAGRRAARLVMPKITPTPAAQRLMSQGVPLTAGQMSPDSAYGHFEEAASHNPLGMQPERAAALEAARNVALNRATAPGAKPPSSGGVQERLRAIYEGFGPAYEEIRNVPVPAEALKGMPKAALKMPGNIDARTKAGVKAEIENALTVLPGYEPPAPSGHHGHGTPATPETPGLLDAYGRPAPPAPKPPKDLPPTTAGDLMKVRENIRAEARTARKSQDFDRLTLLGHAEDVVTDALEKALPAEQSAKLRSIDRQYARYMTLEDAASRGGPDSDFSPKQLGAAVARSAGRRAATQGRAGDLQDLAQDMNAVFEQRVPPTGMRGVVLSGMPKVAAGPLARFVNLPEIRSGLLPGGTFAFPTSGPMPAPQMSLTPQAAAMAEVLRRRIGVGLTPVPAEDTSP